MSDGTREISEKMIPATAIGFQIKEVSFRADPEGGQTPKVRVRATLRQEGETIIDYGVMEVNPGDIIEFPVRGRVLYKLDHVGDEPGE